MADRRRGAVAVVGERVDHDRNAGGAVPLVADLFQPFPGQLPRSPLDRVLDLVGGHVDLARLLHRQPQPEVALQVAAALFRGDRDLAAGARESLPALGVDNGLLVLDPGPLRVARHQIEPPNMLSMILSHDSSKLTPADLDYVAFLQLMISVDLRAVDSYPALLE